MTTPITSQLTIANSALIKVGAAPIGSLTGNGRAAVICNTLFQYLVDEVMGETPWVFAIKQAQLAPNANIPLFTWLYSFDIPADCLRLLVPDDDKINWVVQGSQILCNETTLNMNYLFRNLDPSTWDARFCETVSWRIAMELAMGLIRSVPVAQYANTMYTQTLAQARAMNAVVGTRPPLEADVWSGARKGDNYFRLSQGQGSDGQNYGP